VRESSEGSGVLTRCAREDAALFTPDARTDDIAEGDN